jgi:hypothetical protein
VSFDIDSLDTLEAPCTGTPGKVMYLTQWHIFWHLWTPFEAHCWYYTVHCMLVLV